MHATHTIQEEIGSRLVEMIPDIAEDVIEYFVKQQINKISEAVIKGIDKLKEFDKEFNKINRPDVVTFDETGKAISEGYSKERIDAKRKLNEQRERYVKAIDKALGGDAQNLFELMK